MKLNDDSQYCQNVETPEKLHFVDNITSIYLKFGISKQLNISTNRQNKLPS
jgi:hypothetical protein